MLGTKTFIVVAALACLAALAPVASAQVPATGTTSSDVTGDGISGGIERGASASYFVTWNLCYTGPALNPNGGVFTATLSAISGPEWLETIALPTQPFESAPEHPFLESAEKCSPNDYTWEFKPVVKRDAPYETEDSITVTVSVVADTDVGTYDKGAEGDHTYELAVRTGSPPPEEFPGANTTSPSPGGNGNGGDSGESPGVAPLTLVITLAALAVLRRRQ